MSCTRAACRATPCPTACCNGRLHPVHRGVYAVGHPNLPARRPLPRRRQGLRPGRGAEPLLGGGALGLHRVGRPPPRGDRRRRRARAASRPPRPPHHRFDLDDTTRHRGIPVTSPARTLLDLAARLDHRPLRSATRRAQSLHRVNVRQLVDVLARHRRRPRLARSSRRIVATGPAPTRSELEDAVLDLILRGGLAHPRVNEPLRRQRPPRRPRLPLARAASRRRGRRRRVARQPARARGRRRAPGAARGPRRARAARHLGAGDHRPARTLARLRAAGAPYTERADDQHQPAQERQPHRGRRDDLQGRRVPARQARQGRGVRAHQAAPRLATATSSTRPSAPARSSAPCAPRRAR